MVECTCGYGEDELTKQVDAIIDEHKDNPGSLIQVLTKVQNLVGYLPTWVLIRVAKGLGLSLQEVYGVATFYAFFSLIPRGRHKISVCAGTACYVKGTKKILKALREILGVKEGQTTPDSRFTVETVRCIGACGLAPAMVIDGTVHGKVDPEKLPEILEQYA